MNDTITRLMGLADVYADWAITEGNKHLTYVRTRKALEDELTRLFTPLSDAQIEKMAMEEVGLIIDDDSPFCDSDIMKVFELVRCTEAKHGIGGGKS